MLLESFLISLAANAAFGLSVGSAKAAARWLITNNPKLEERFSALDSGGNEKAFIETAEEVTNSIVAAAQNGRLEIDGASMKALQDIRFDHQNGQIVLNDISIFGKGIVTGGGANAKGTTTIQGDSTLKTEGTKIKLTKGAKITMTGNANIKQT